MLIVSGVIEVAEADLEKAKAAVVDMMAATQKEKGCIRYEFSQLIGNPAQFRLFEEWESEETLGAHFQTEHMAAFRKVLGEMKLVSSEIYMIKDGTRVPLGG